MTVTHGNANSPKPGKSQRKYTETCAVTCGGNTFKLW